MDSILPYSSLLNDHDTDTVTSLFLYELFGCEWGGERYGIGGRSAGGAEGCGERGGERRGREKGEDVKCEWVRFSYLFVDVWVWLCG